MVNIISYHLRVCDSFFFPSTSALLVLQECRDATLGFINFNFSHAFSLKTFLMSPKRNMRIAGERINSLSQARKQTLQNRNEGNKASLKNIHKKKGVVVEWNITSWMWHIFSYCAVDFALAFSICISTAVEIEWQTHRDVIVCVWTATCFRSTNFADI